MTTTVIPVLDVRDLSAGYDGRSVVFDVSLTVAPAETVVLIGANGAGKTTTLSAIVGLIDRRQGSVAFSGRQQEAGKPWLSARHGVCLVPAEKTVFGDLDVLENLRLGAYTVSDKAAVAERIDDVCALFPRLADRQRQKALTMSGGEQRMLSLGIALMADPTVLLLDEPSVGLSPRFVETIMEAVETLVRDKGISVLMVEQNISHALAIADRAYVLRSGRVILEEPAAALRDRESLWELF